MDNEFIYLLYGVKMTYSEFYNNINNEDDILISKGFDLDDHKIYVVIDEENGNYVYVGNILSKSDDNNDQKYKNANPLNKRHIHQYLDELFDSSFIVRPVLYHSVKHYY